MAAGDVHDQERVRIGRFETLGAWLHVWTPPRDAVVPAVPKRRLAIGAAAVALVLAALAAWLIPRIDSSKRATAQRERFSAAAFAARERERLTRDQRLHEARGSAPSAASASDRRTRLVGELERSITLDARQRVAAGTLTGPIIATSCHPYTGAPAGSSRPRGMYECTAVTGAIARGRGNVAGAVGYPFWARVDFSGNAYVWCKTNPRPGERGVGGEAVIVPLPAPCDLRRELSARAPARQPASDAGSAALRRSSSSRRSVART
jgi:hypothetical protein